jgi:hypothetical protein
MKNFLRRLFSIDNIPAIVVALGSLYVAWLNYQSPQTGPDLFTAMLVAISILSVSLVIERMTVISRIEENTESLKESSHSIEKTLVSLEEQSGIHVWETRDSTGVIGGFEGSIKPAKEEILTASINFETTANRYRIALKHKAEEGCVVKFLTIKPRVGPGKEMNPVVEATARTIGSTPEKLLEQIERNLETIWKEGRTLPDDLWQIRVHQAIGSIFLSIDGDKPHGRMYLSIYPYGEGSSNIWPLIEMRPSLLTGRTYKMLYQSFLRMFEEAEPWSPDEMG